MSDSDDDGRCRRRGRGAGCGGGSGLEQTVVLAAYYGRCDALLDALRRGGDIEECDPKEGWRPIHAATMTDSEEVVKELLRFRANVDAPGPKGMAALHIACRNGSVSLVRTLLEARADHSKQDCEGQTPSALCKAGGKAQMAVEAFLEGRPFPPDDSEEGQGPCLDQQTEDRAAAQPIRLLASAPQTFLNTLEKPGPSPPGEDGEVARAGDGAALAATSSSNPDAVASREHWFGSSVDPDIEEARQLAQAEAAWNMPGVKDEKD